jgi:AcrR family transcriptional regulator
MRLSGARVDAIAERTNTTKRRLYYYSGNEERLYEAVAAQQFRGEIEPVNLRLFTSSLCFQRVANRHTFTVAFRRDPSGARSRARHRQLIIDTVMRFMQR